MSGKTEFLLCAVLFICTESMKCATRERRAVWVHRIQSVQGEKWRISSYQPVRISPISRDERTICLRIRRVLWIHRRAKSILLLFSVVTKWVWQISCWYYLPRDSKFCLNIEALKYQRKKRCWKRVKNSGQSLNLLATLIKLIWFTCTNRTRMDSRTLEELKGWNKSIYQN